MGLKIVPISKNKCNICWGTGKSHDFQCPLCGSFTYGSSTSGHRLKRHCKECIFVWMDYEDRRYFKLSDSACLACNGTGLESVWIL